MRQLIVMAEQPDLNQSGNARDLEGQIGSVSLSSSYHSRHAINQDRARSPESHDLSSNKTGSSSDVKFAS